VTALDPAGGQPILALFSAIAARRVSDAPDVALPGGRLKVTGVAIHAQGLDIELTGIGPLGLHTRGAVLLRITSVGTDHAFLRVGAEGGLAFRTIVKAAMTAGELLEPLLRAFLGRPLRQGLEMHGDQLRVSYGPLLHALLGDGERG
jgi:hypothetical protein